MKDSQEEVTRILLCRLGGIGDVVHTLPLAKFLKKKHKYASVEYLTSSNVAPILENYCPYLDRVWSFDKKNKAKIANEINLEKNKVDYFFNLHSSLSFFFFNLFYIRANRFFQYKKNNRLHAVVNFVSIYDPNISAFEIDSKVLIDDRDELELLKTYGLLSRNYICLVPGVGKVRLNRAWPISRWSELARGLLKLNPNLKVVYLGGPDEQSLINKFSNIGDGVVNLIGALNLLDTTRIISRAANLISCDTGLLHLAAGLSVNNVGLYGPTKLERSGPFTSNCHLVTANDCKCRGVLDGAKSCIKTKERHGYCMEDIEIEDILSKLNFSCGLVRTSV